MYDNFQGQNQSLSQNQNSEQNQSLNQNQNLDQNQGLSQNRDLEQDRNLSQSWNLDQNQGLSQSRNLDQNPNRNLNQNSSQSLYQNQRLNYTSGQANQSVGSGSENQRSGVYSGAAGSVNGMSGGMQENGTYRYSSRYPNNFTTPQMNESVHSAHNVRKQQNEKKQMGGFKKILLSAGMGICFGLCAGLSFLAVEKLTGLGARKPQTVDLTELTNPIGEIGNKETSEQGETNEGSQVTAASTLSGGVTNTIVSDVSGVVKEVMPSVVSIVNTFTERYSYFGQNFSQEANASGSGIIVGMNDTELLIVTNYHVVEDADMLMVSFVDDSASEAQVKGTNASRDLAVIAVPLSEMSEETKNSISVAKLGDSDSLTVGEPAIAIGNALGYGQSVTTGVVSALNREIADSDTGSATFIQTDAAINPGNSGGALLNANGEVIGINSNKIGGTAVEGMGYAIPISAAKPIIEELMSRETKTKVDAENAGYLGISGVSVTPDVANVYGMPEGVYVAKVYEGTGAYAAGITQGSIITKLDGISITAMEDLSGTLQYYRKGDSVELTIMQPGFEGYEEKMVTVVLGSRAE